MYRTVTPAVVTGVSVPSVVTVPPVAAINSVPIVGGDFDQEALARVLDHVALNQAAASLYRDRFDSTPGVVYAAGVRNRTNESELRRIISDAGYLPVQRDTLYRAYFLKKLGR